jgi:hypothetical protein
MPLAMTSAGSTGPVEHAAYDEAFPRVGDALTLHVWRGPAFPLTRSAAAVGVPATAVTLLEALLAGLVFALFWQGRYWPGLLVAVAVMPVSLVAHMMSRLGHSQDWANRARIAVEVAVPLFWWWAWEHGLAAYGRPFHPVYAMMVLWVVVAGTIAISVIEGLALHRFGMEIHAWRPLDSRFRLVSAARNSDLVILAGGLLFRRPDSGLVLVAWWTLISLIVHSVRLAQLTEQQARRHKIASWLER